MVTLKEMSNIAAFLVFLLSVGCAPTPEPPSSNNGSSAAPTPATAETASSAAVSVGETIATGNFVGVAKQKAPTTGAASIQESTYGGPLLTFDDAFSTPDGPDVEVILYRGDEVPAAIEEADYVTIAPIQSFTGSQQYRLPSDVDLSEFGSIGIWCRQFNVTFGSATLQQ